MQVMATTAARFATELAQRGSNPALLGDESLTYAQLEIRVAERAECLAGPRRVHVLIARNAVDFVVDYLACLRIGHVVALTTACHADQVMYAHATELHPDLAVLLPTSGSTGNPKLVRLSGHNLQSNAESIACALDLRETDRALTSLPAAYSYGLSVINSTLVAGGALVLTPESVMEPQFWSTAREHRATLLAGVPYTFELLDRLGADVMATVASLRLVTCAGGRLPAAAVRRWASVGDVQGWGLAVMYGQTEATARMAVLPPAQAMQHPESVGFPVPGGHFEIRDPDSAGVGEIVYRGPNVMMGYATTVDDLARGAEVEELLTGDLGRVVDGRLFVTGRRARFAKVRGLRIDLADVERALEPDVAVCEELPESLGVVSDAPMDRVLRRVMTATGLPAAAVHVVQSPVPRLDNGKVDRRSVAELLAARSSTPPAGDECAQLTAAYTRLLGAPAGPADSFRGLGGDSMSYVAVSVEVERILGYLPDRWHEIAICELVDAPTVGRGAEMSIVLRAMAILLVLGSHAAVIDIRGGAHLLMALVGYNFARFQIGRPARAIAASIGWMLAPALIWVVLMVSWAWQPYTASALGLTWITQPVTDGPDWRYWFIGALLWILPAVALLSRAAAMARWRGRYPFEWAVMATLVSVVIAVAAVPDARPSSLFSPLAVLWVFFLGWAVWEARALRQRIVVSALSALLVSVMFAQTRLWVIGVGLLLLVWVPRLRMPKVLAVCAAALGPGVPVHLPGALAGSRHRTQLVGSESVAAGRVGHGLGLGQGGSGAARDVRPGRRNHRP